MLLCRKAKARVRGVSFVISCFYVLFCLSPYVQKECVLSQTPVVQTCVPSPLRAEDSEGEAEGETEGDRPWNVNRMV